MVRPKGNPQHNLSAADSAADKVDAELSIRVRSSKGVQPISGVTAKSTLAHLRTAIEAALGGALSSLSFRSDDMITVNLIAEGCYPALGVLLIGPESRLAELGIEDQTSMNCSLSQIVSKRELSAEQDVQPKKKKKAKNEAGCSFNNSQLSASSSSSSPLSSFSSSSASSSTASRDPSDDIAMRFLHAGADQGDSLNGSKLASHFHTTADGAKRLEAASKGLAEVTNQGKSINVTFKTTPNGVESTDRVKMLTTDQCAEICAKILVRNAGSKRRRTAMLSRNGGAGPSTKVLTPSCIATRCPELFWALYDNSRSDRAEAGDMDFALDHVVKAALEKFEEIVSAEE